MTRWRLGGSSCCSPTPCTVLSVWLPAQGPRWLLLLLPQHPHPSPLGGRKGKGQAELFKDETRDLICRFCSHLGPGGVATAKCREAGK